MAMRQPFQAAPMQSELHQLQQENAALRQQLGLAMQARQQIGEALLCALIDALGAVAAMAKSGNPAAQMIIANYRKNNDLAAEAPTGGGLIVAGAIQPNGQN